jgi:hypothetical protein
MKNSQFHKKLFLVGKRICIKKSKSIVITEFDCSKIIVRDKIVGH